MTGDKQVTLFKLYHYTFLVFIVSGFVSIFVSSIPLKVLGLFLLTGYGLIIVDLCMSSASTSEKVAWSLVLVLLQMFVLPFYWYAFLRRGKNSWCLEQISKLDGPTVSGDGDKPPLHS